MINLLPPQLKEDYGYARRNNSLLRIVTAFGIGIAGVALIVVAGLLYLQRSADTYNAQATEIEASMEAQNKDEIESNVQEISNRLKLAVQVLSQEILFSQLLKQLAVVTPNNVNLSSVSIDEFGGGIDIAAEALDYNTASQLQVNLADPQNKIFAKADIVSIVCEHDSTKRLPCKVTVRALFTADNPFLFINGNAVGN